MPVVKEIELYLLQIITLLITMESFSPSREGYIFLKQDWQDQMNI